MLNPEKPIENVSPDKILPLEKSEKRQLFEKF